MTKRKHRTNEQFLGKVFAHSVNYGPLKACMVIQAIEQFANKVMVAKLPQNGMVHPDAWRGVAKELLADIAEQYDR